MSALHSRRELGTQKGAPFAFSEQAQAREMAGLGSRLYLCSISAEENQGTEIQGWGRFRYAAVWNRETRLRETLGGS